MQKWTLQISARNSPSQDRYRSPDTSLMNYLLRHLPTTKQSGNEILAMHCKIWKQILWNVHFIERKILFILFLSEIWWFLSPHALQEVCGEIGMKRWIFYEPWTKSRISNVFWRPALVWDYQAPPTVVVRLCWPGAMSFCFIKQIAASRCELQIPRLEIMDQLGHYELLKIGIQLKLRLVLIHPDADMCVRCETSWIMWWFSVIRRDY